MTAALRHPVAAIPPQPAARPLSPQASDGPAAGEIRKLFAALERNLATMPTDGDRVVYVNIQIEAWESREAEMQIWAQCNPHIGTNRFVPWTAFSVATVVARLGAMHAALVDKIKAATVEAMAALPEM